MNIIARYFKVYSSRRLSWPQFLRIWTKKLTVFNNNFRNRVKQTLFAYFETPKAQLLVLHYLHAEHPVVANLQDNREESISMLVILRWEQELSENAVMPILLYSTTTCHTIRRVQFRIDCMVMKLSRAQSWYPNRKENMQWDKVGRTIINES
jgi:hypothetical protein